MTNGDDERTEILTVALFEGDPQGSGLRLLDRTQNKQLVAYVQRWFAKQAKGDLALK